MRTDIGYSQQTCVAPAEDEKNKDSTQFFPKDALDEIIPLSRFVLNSENIKLYFGADGLLD